MGWMGGASLPSVYDWRCRRSSQSTSASVSFAPISWQEQTSHQLESHRVQESRETRTVKANTMSRQGNPNSGRPAPIASAMLFACDSLSLLVGVLISSLGGFTRKLAERFSVRRTRLREEDEMMEVGRETGDRVSVSGCPVDLPD